MSKITTTELELITTTIQLAVNNATQNLAVHGNTMYLTRKQAAAALHISLTTLTEYTKIGKIKGYRIGRFVLYKPHEIDADLTLIKTTINSKKDR